MYTLPAESVTLAAVGPAQFHASVTTTSRLPAVTFDAGVTDRPLTLPTESRCADARWTNPGLTTALGVTACDAAEAGPAPRALLADTLKV